MGSVLAKEIKQAELVQKMKFRLEKHRDFLVDRIDPDFGLLDDLLASGALTREDTHKIKRKYGTAEERNRKLLDIVLNKNKVVVFHSALRDNGQKHLVNYLDANGKHESKFSDDWPLHELDICRLNINHRSLVDLLDTSDLCIRLFSAGVINNRQKQFISFKPIDAEKNEALLDMLTKFSYRQYNKTIDCLKDSNQSHIADLLSKGGAVVQIHADLEGAVGSVDEEEIITKLTTVLENQSSEEATRLLDLTKQRIIAARKGHSIVIYIHCQTHDALKQLDDQLKTNRLHENIGRVFTEVHPLGDPVRVQLTWSEVELKEAAEFFENLPATSMLAIIAGGAAAGAAVGSILPGFGSVVGVVVGGVGGAVGSLALADAIYGDVHVHGRRGESS